MTRKTLRVTWELIDDQGEVEYVQVNTWNKLYEVQWLQMQNMGLKLLNAIGGLGKSWGVIKKKLKEGATVEDILKDD